MKNFKSYRIPLVVIAGLSFMLGASFAYADDYLITNFRFVSPGENKLRVLDSTCIKQPTPPETWEKAKIIESLDCSKSRANILFEVSLDSKKARIGSSVEQIVNTSKDPGLSVTIEGRTVTVGKNQ